MYSNYGAPEYDTRASKRPKTEGNMWDESETAGSYGYGYSTQPAAVSDNYLNSYSSYNTGSGQTPHRSGVSRGNSTFGDWLAKSGSQDSGLTMGGDTQGLYDNSSSAYTGYGGYGDAAEMDTPSYAGNSGMMELDSMSNIRGGRGSQMRSDSSYNFGRDTQSQIPVRSTQQSTAGSYMTPRSGISKPKLNTSRGGKGTASSGRFVRRATNSAGRSSESGGRGGMSGSGGMRRDGNMGSGLSGMGSMGSGQQRGFRGQMDERGGGVAENDEEDDDFMTNLTLRMAAEMQQKKHGKLDVKKILKVMEIVDKLTDSGGQDDVSQVEQFVKRSSGSGTGGFRGGGGGGGSSGGGGGAAQQSNMNMMNTNMMMDGSNMMNRMGMMNQMQGMNFNPMQQQQQQSMGGMMGSMMGEGMGFGGGQRFGGNMGMGGMFNAGDGMPGFSRGRGGGGGGGPGFRGMPGNRGRMDRSPTSLMDMHLTGSGRPFSGQQKFRPEKRRHPGDQPSPRGRGFNPGGFNPRQQNPGMMGFPPRGFPPKNLSERLHRFCEILRQHPHIPNPISKLEDNLNLSGLNLTLDYKFEELVRCGAKFVVTGRLSIGNIFIARAMGEKKKDVKFACYKKALRTLLNTPANSIMSQKDKNTETLKKELLDEFEQRKGTDDKDDKRSAGLKNYEEELQKLISSLKSPPEEECESDLALLTAAVKASECGLVHTYTEVTTYVTPTVVMYTGRLSIAGTLLGTAAASLRRNAKSHTYTAAVAFLKETELEDIVKGYESSEDEMTTAMFRELVERQTTLPNDKTESKLAQLINAAAKIPKTGDVSTAMDKAVTDANLLLTLLSKRSKLEGGNALAASEMYIDNIFIADGEGVKQPEAKAKVYEGVLSVLSNSSADVLVNEGRRLSQDDLQKVMLVREIWAKGECSTFYWSNFSKMKAGKNMKRGLYFCEDADEVPGTKENMIIVESHRYSADRYKFAYDILLQSATMNLMLLHGKTVWYANMHRCEIFLEGEKVSEAIAKSRAGATMKAASKFLFELYQERTTIKTALETENAVWHSYETIKETADKLKLEKGGDSESDDMIDIIEPPPKASQTEVNGGTEDDAESKEEPMETDGKTEGKSDVKKEGKPEGKAEGDRPANLKVNKWVKEVVDGMICEFAKRDTLEDLVLGVGFPDGERRQMFLTASENKLYCTNRKNNKQEMYTVVYHKFPIAKQLEILEASDGVCGKFSILPKESLPSLDKMKELMQASLKASQQKRATTANKNPEWKGRNKNRSNKRHRPENKGKAAGSKK